MVRSVFSLFSKNYRIQKIFFLFTVFIWVISYQIPNNTVYAFGNEETRKEIKAAVEFKDYEKLYEIVAPFAKQGDSEAQLHLCILNWYGMGTPSRVHEAINWCEKAAKNISDAKSTSDIEELLDYFKSVLAKAGKDKTSKDGILKELRQQANNGDGKAQWLLYLAHDKGLVEAGKQDKEKRQQWLDMAISSDFPAALIQVARRWLTSDEPETQKKFVSYMERAAKQGDSYAMYLLGSFYQPWEIRGKEEEPHRDYEKAIYWYRKAAQIDGSGAFRLAQLLRSYKNPIQDPDEAFQWTELAAKDGEQEAQIALAELYEEGATVRRSYQSAFKWYSKASEHEIYNFNFSRHSTAGFKVAIYLLDGKGVARNPQKAFKVLKRISDHEHADIDLFRNNYTGLSRYVLGFLYENGIGSEKDTEEALHYYEKSASQGEILAIRRRDFLTGMNAKVKRGIIQDIQTELKNLGYRVGAVDGAFGAKTFEALRAYQCTSGEKITGIPSQKVLSAIRQYVANTKKFAPEIWNEKLFKAISRLDVDCVTAALVNGANPNSTKYRYNPLGMLINARPDMSHDDLTLRDLKLTIAKLLISYGTKPNVYNSGLFSAISDGNTKFLRLLLDNRISPIAKIEGKRLIEWAAYYDQPEIERLLVEYGASPLSKQQKAQERLVNSPSLSGGGILKARGALNAGAHLNMYAADGATVLVESLTKVICNPSALNFLKFLLESGADPNREAKNLFVGIEGIPLHMFIFMNEDSMNGKYNAFPGREKATKYSVAAMNLLLDHGANIASRDKKGLAPLHVAAKRDNLVAAKMLLDKGALATHRDATGALPVDYAESAKMITLLKSTPSASHQAKKKTNISGSGFLVSPSGHIVTNAHVINGCDAIKFGSGSGTSYPAKIISMDTRNDIALLKPMKSGGYEVSPSNVTFLRDKDVNLGESVIVAGYPYGTLVSSSVKITSGIVSSIKGFEDNTSQFQIDAAVQPGNSGGPIFDSQGNVVGVVVAQLNKIKMAKAVGSLPENTNFGIKGSSLKSFLESANIEMGRSFPKKATSIETVAKIASSSTLMITCIQE